jgi:hypothetical protein
MVTRRRAMTRKVRILLAALIACACLVIAAVAWGAETLTTHVSFNPDKLGAPTNVSGTARLSATAETVPSPLRQVTVYLPAGLKVDVRGAGTCTAAKLEAGGPSACSANSRIGFGGGTGLLEIAKEIIRGPFTLDLFLGPRENGHLVVLVYATAVSPASEQLVVVAREVHAPKPYGLGFTVEIPLIPTLPEAPEGSIASVFLTFGDKHVAYSETAHGTRKLVHVRGVVAPRTCPSGGFPYEVLASFADGNSLTDTGTIPCPHR